MAKFNIGDRVIVCPNFMLTRMTGTIGLIHNDPIRNYPIEVVLDKPFGEINTYPTTESELILLPVELEEK